MVGPAGQTQCVLNSLYSFDPFQNSQVFFIYVSVWTKET